MHSPKIDNFRYSWISLCLQNKTMQTSDDGWIKDKGVVTTTMYKLILLAKQLTFSSDYVTSAERDAYQFVGRGSKIRNHASTHSKTNAEFFLVLSSFE